MQLPISWLKARDISMWLSIYKGFCIQLTFSDCSKLICIPSKLYSLVCTLSSYILHMLCIGKFYYVIYAVCSCFIDTYVPCILFSFHYFTVSQSYVNWLYIYTARPYMVYHLFTASDCSSYSLTACIIINNVV